MEVPHLKKAGLSLRELVYLYHDRRLFEKRMGYRCDLRNPRTYSEKIFWRKLYDRNPLFPVVQDKFRVRDYLREVLGEDRAYSVLPALYFATADPERIPFDTLPGRYFVKASHGSGWVIPVENAQKADRQDIVRRCREWVNTPYKKEKLEWSYSQMKPMILVEEFLDENGKVPTDHKCLVFGGKVRLVYFYYDRFGTPAEAFFDENGTRLFIAGKHEADPSVRPPANYGDVIALAEELGRPFDFMRVDLYSIGGRVRFGEMTAYPGSGYYPYPREMDELLGSYWQLPRLD